MASVEEDFICDIVWELEGEPYTKYYQELLTVTPDKKHYLSEIISDSSDAAANFKFLLSNSENTGKTIYLDSIVLSSERWLYGEPVAVEGVKINAHGFNVYPNPAGDHFNVSGIIKDEQIVDISLFNIVGQKEMTLYSGLLVPGEFRKQFPTNGIPEGIYNIQISLDNESINKLLIVD